MVELFVVFILLIVVLLLLKKPSNELNWKAQYARLPEIVFGSNQFDIKHIRDFRYDALGHITEAHYQNQTFHFSELNSVWFGLSHFGPLGLAHAFMSFGFGDGRYLVISIETRLRTDQHHYHPIKGLFRNYTKIILLATEQDVIGLRSHIRKESVFLYPLKMSNEDQRLLLLNFLTRAKKSNSKPVFYNTLIGNCLTGLLWESKYFNHWHQWFDYRIILPGYADRLLNKLQLLSKEKPFKELRVQAQVNEQGYAIDDENFSKKIRGNI